MHLSRSWIQRDRRCLLRAALVMREGWTALLHEAVDRGRSWSPTSVSEAFTVSGCPFGRWLLSGEADVLDPFRAAEVRDPHAEHHRISALLLVEVGAGHVDEARRLMNAQDGHAGTTRASRDAVRSWIEALDP